MPRVSTVTLLLHGAGSCPATAYALLEPAVAPGSRAVCVDARGTVAQVEARLADAVGWHRQDGDEVVRVAGISLGAHAVASWASHIRTMIDLVLVMPAWTGAPDAVAAATAAAADEIERLGVRAVLDRLRADPATSGDWVLDELGRGWATYDDAALVASLREAGSSPAPTFDELHAVRARTAVVALADDPLHPDRVARAWAGAITCAAIRVVPRTAPATDRGALGRAGAEALEALSGSR
jgi:hypothetical protein